MRTNKNTHSRLTNFAQHPPKQPPIVSIVGYSGAGKTTFLEKLIPAIKYNGYKVGVIKHDVHGFDIDKPGKDSWRLKQAGAEATLISSPQKIGLVKDVYYDHKPRELLSFFTEMDIIFCEGYKQEPNPKIEVFRSEINSEPLCRDDEHLLALISDTNVAINVPIFANVDVKGVAQFIITHFNLASAHGIDARRNAANQDINQ